MQVSYEVGDVVERRYFGGGVGFVRVAGVEDDVKGGRPGFTGVPCDEAGAPIADGSTWGYSEQVIRVVS
jgi:hypothetical protein